MTAVTFRRDAIAVETTRYVQYERFRDVAALAIGARQAVDPVDGVDRLGLRYIDEIRVPDIGVAPVGWEPWVDASLLGPAAAGAKLGVAAAQLQGAVLFDMGPAGPSCFGTAHVRAMP
jgi:uncharacterized protein (TIGR04255 family)